MKPLNGKFDRFLMIFSYIFYNRLYFSYIYRLDNNAEADADDMKEQKKKLEDKVQPIITKLYAGSEGGEAGGDGGDKHDKDEL